MIDKRNPQQPIFIDANQPSNALPFTVEVLESLIEHVDTLVVPLGQDPKGRGTIPCDQTLELTEGFLAKSGDWSSEAETWLNDHGGYCDCEVALNVGHWFYQEEEAK